MIILILIGIVAGAVILASRPPRVTGDAKLEASSRAGPGVFFPTETQWATVTVEPVQQRVFRSEHVTEGKVAVDED